MPGESDGLSREEFLVLQEQLLNLRNRNYELQEELKKKTNEIQQLSSNNAFQFASKLINRSSSSKKDDDFENLRKKLEIQEEEFKLQQSTLFQEMNSLSAENDKLKNQLKSHPLEKGPENNSDFEEQLEKMTKKAEDSEKLTRDLEDMLLENRKKLEDSKKKLGDFGELQKELDNIKKYKEIDAGKIRELEDELVQMQLKLTDSQENSGEQEKLVEEYKNRSEQQEKEINSLKIWLSEANAKIEEEKSNFELTILEKNAMVEKIQLEFSSKSSEEFEQRLFLLESRFKLEIDDLKKEHEDEITKLDLKIQKLEEKIKGHDEEKRIALKKQSAIIKELQKTVKEERKRADSYEKKNEEKQGWHVVQESDGQSSHTYDGNESISSLSAIESENVELITRLASLQRINSENTDRILQLESENSKMSREVFEKGELIENWIREKPISSSQNSSPRNLTDFGFRKLLTNLGQDQGAQDLKEMNKKLQRMLEETLSKNILLQRDIQTLLERTEM